MSKVLVDREGLAHELWAVAQLAPGEGVADGVARLVALLAQPAQTEQQPERSGLSNNVFIVWNERTEEGVVFADLADAQYAATGRPMPGTFGVSTIGDAFRETYADDEPGLEFPIIRAALSAQGGE